MSLLERKTIDKIEILENCMIQVREATIIEKNGVEITRSFHRYVVSPGQDLTGQDPKVLAVANSVWTQEVIDAYLASLTSDPLLS